MVSFFYVTFVVNIVVGVVVAVFVVVVVVFFFVAVGNFFRKLAFEFCSFCLKKFRIRFFWKKNAIFFVSLFMRGYQKKKLIYYVQ